MIRIARRLRVNQTDAETVLWNRIRNRQIGGHKFVWQEPISGYVCDFVCRERLLIVEVDGGQHSESATDSVRDRRLTEKGYKSASVLEQRCPWQSRRRADDDSG
jgi:very-short-patch-repair endonuclease